MDITTTDLTGGHLLQYPHHIIAHPIKESRYLVEKGRGLVQMRLIDGDTLKEAFYQKMKELLKSTDTPQISNEALSLLCGASLITEAKTIEERKTGTWCCSPDGRIFCSNCQRVPINRILVKGSLVYDMTPIREKMKYCPNCGANMIGKRDDS